MTTHGSASGCEQACGLLGRSIHRSRGNLCSSTRMDVGCARSEAYAQATDAAEVLPLMDPATHPGTPQRLQQPALLQAWGQRQGSQLLNAAAGGALADAVPEQVGPHRCIRSHNAPAYESPVTKPRSNAYSL